MKITSAMPFIMHADGCGITSAAGTLFRSSFARDGLFVLLSEPSAVDNAHGRGPSG